MSQGCPTPHPTPMLCSPNIILTLPSVRQKKIISNFPINIAWRDRGQGLHYISQPTLQRGGGGKMEVPFCTGLTVQHSRDTCTRYSIAMTQARTCLFARVPAFCILDLLTFAGVVFRQSRFSLLWRQSRLLRCRRKSSLRKTIYLNIPCPPTYS